MTVISAVKAWVSVTEVNSEVRMPIISVTPKPRMAPVPMVVSASAAIRWVTLASRMVDQAFS